MLAGHGGGGTVIVAYAVPRPQPVINSSSPGPVSAAFTATFSFNLPVAGFVAGDVTPGNATLSNFSGSGASYTATVTPISSGPVTLDIAAATAQDAAVTTVQSLEASRFTIQAQLNPLVVEVTSSTADGFYRAGQTVTAEVVFDKTVTVTGTPQLTIETGSTDRAMVYTGGTGGTRLTFTHVVQPGDASGDLDYVDASALSLSGGTIRDADGLDAILTLPAPGASGSLGANKAIVIDTTPPVVSDPNISLSGATGPGGAFRVGDTVTATWSAAGGDGDPSLDIVTIDFSAFGGNAAVTASQSGTDWTAFYAIVESTSTSGSNLNVSVTAIDAAGNATTTMDTSDATVDAAPPSVSAPAISLSGATGTGGTYRIGNTVTAVWDDGAGGDGNGDIASAAIDFAEFGGGVIAAGESGERWSASYQVTAGSIDAVGRKVSVTATDTAGNATTGAGSPDAVVDDIAPIVTPGAISVSGATGNPGNSVFRIGDTVTVEWDDTGAGDGNADTIDAVTVDFADFGGTSDSAAANDAGIWRASYVIPAGTLMGSDLTISVTATDDAGNTATTVDDSRSDGDTVQTEAPDMLALTDATNSGSKADLVTNVARPTIIGRSEPGTTITVLVGGVTVGTATADGAGDWIYAFQADLAQGDNSIAVTATDAVGNVSDPSEPLLLTIDLAGPGRPDAPSLDEGSNSGNADDSITDVAGPVVLGSAEPGGTVEVFVGGVLRGTTVADASGTWSRRLPDDALVEGDNLVTITATDSAANISTASDPLTITLDTTPPVVSDANISLSGATGPGGAFRVGDTVTATWTATGGDGDATLFGATVDFSAFGGGAAVPASQSGTTWIASYMIVEAASISGSTLNASVTATDGAGNATTTADTSDATVDAVPPMVSAATISLSGATGTGGTYRIGDTVTAIWDDTEDGGATTDAASVSIDFAEFGGGAVAANESGGTWRARYEVVAGSTDATERNVSVTVTDTAGNVDGATGTNDVLVDTIAPTVTPGAISVSGATGNPGNSVFRIGDTVVVEWDDTGSGDGNEDTIDAVTVDMTAFGGSDAVLASNDTGIWRASYVIPQGSLMGSDLTVAVTATDDAGNATTTADDSESTGDNVRTEAPDALTLSDGSNSGSKTDRITNVARPTISGRSEPGATITVLVNGVPVSAATADAAGDWSYAFDADLAESDNSITVTAADAVGNVSVPSEPLLLTIDTRAPAQPGATTLNPDSNSGDRDDTVTNVADPVISGTAEPGSIVEVFVGGVSAGTTVADASGAWTLQLPEGALAEGDNLVTVSATDSAGNVSAVSDPLTITLDTTAPDIAIDDPVSGDGLVSNAEAPDVAITGTTANVADDLAVEVTVSDGSDAVTGGTTAMGDVWTLTLDLSGLADGTLTITAVVDDVAGNPAAQASATALKDTDPMAVAITGPEGIVAAAFGVTITFDEPAFGVVLSDVTVVEGTATALTGSGSVYTATIDPDLGKTVQVSVAAGAATDAAGNPNTASNTFEIESGSPASEFERYREEIREIVVGEAERSLQSTLSSNRRMTSGARDRFIALRRQAERCAEATIDNETRDACDTDPRSAASVPFDINGSAGVSGGVLGTRGTFSEQRADAWGTGRRLIFGDFDIQRTADEGLTATLDGRVAWERLYGDRTMLGTFIGAEIGRSRIDSGFTGDNTRIGINVGGYAVRKLGTAAYLDGFASLCFGRNDLSIGNDVLDLDSDYTTRTATFGLALSGVFPRRSYELRPELALSWGRTWIGDVGFTGRAYGLVDDDLSLDAGNVTIGNVALGVEVLVPLDGRGLSESDTVMTFAPRLVCEQVRGLRSTKDCGGGVELGLSSLLRGGLGEVEFGLSYDRVGQRSQTSVRFGVEQRF